MIAEFDGWDFAAGHVVGVRKFGIASFGRLLSVNQFHIWTPGENLAECAAAHWVRQSFPASIALTAAGPAILHEEMEWARRRRPPHDLHGCTCGFYAFTSRQELCQYDAPVVGVIHGYGKVVQGTKGFRCEKARVVAVVTGRGYLTREEARLVEQSYPDAATYPKVDDMLEAHPLTPVEVEKPTPATDLTFWARLARVTGQG